MSGTPVEPLDIREQIVRIDRNIAETQKLFAEAAKFKRNRELAVWQVFAINVTAVAAVAGATAALIKLFGT